MGNSVKRVALLGDAGAGKDELGLKLAAQHGFVRVAFADALKREVCEAFNVSLEFINRRDTKETPLPELALQHCQDPGFLAAVGEGLDITAPRSPRWVLQRWGTEYRRAQDEDYWVKLAIAEVRQHISEDRNVVLTDVRAPNEAREAARLGGLLVRVVRPTIAAQWAARRAAGCPEALHDSALLMAAYPVDVEVTNVEGNPEAMYLTMCKHLGLHA